MYTLYDLLHFWIEMTYKICKTSFHFDSQYYMKEYKASLH